MNPTDKDEIQLLLTNMQASIDQYKQAIQQVLDRDQARENLEKIRQATMSVTP